MINEKIYQYLSNQAAEFVDYWVAEYYIHTEEHKLRATEKNYLEAYKKESYFLYQASLEAQYHGSDYCDLFKGLGEDRAAMSTPYKEVYENFFKFCDVMIDFLIHAQKAGKLEVSDGKMVDYIQMQKQQAIKSHYALFEGYMNFNIGLFQ